MALGVAVAAGLVNGTPDRAASAQPDRRDARNQCVVVRGRPRHLGRIAAAYDQACSPRSPAAKPWEFRTRCSSRSSRSRSRRWRSSPPWWAAASRPWARTPCRPRDRTEDQPTRTRGVRLGPGPLLARRRAARRHHRSADRVPGRRIPASVGRGRRTRRHLATRREGKHRRHRVGRAVPHPAPAVRSALWVSTSPSRPWSRPLRLRSEWVCTASIGRRYGSGCGRPATRLQPPHVITAGPPAHH